MPDHIRSDSGSEFTAERVGVKKLSIEPGSPWENGYVESFNGSDQRLSAEQPNITNEAVAHLA